jgi:transcription elongation GreA/GreB family factor
MLFCLTTFPECVTTVQITPNQNNPSAGIISENHPLAQAMLGAHIGDKVFLVDEKGRRTYIIKKIIKGDGASATS